MVPTQFNFVTGDRGAPHRGRQPYFTATTPDEIILKNVVATRFKNRCKKCKQKLYRVRSRRAYACGSRHMVHPLAGTALHKSTTELHKWGIAAILFVQNPQVSAMRIKRSITVTYKAAWRIRQCFKDDPSLAQQIVRWLGVK